MGQKDENEVANVQANEDVDVKERARKKRKKVRVNVFTFQCFFEYLSINNDITHIQVPKNQSSTNKRRKTEKK